MDEYRKTRRRHSAEFKSQVVQACSVPGASTAAVALAFGLNANLVRQWIKGRSAQRSSLGQAPLPEPTPAPAFVALALPPAERTPVAAPVAGTPDIRIDVRRHGLHVNVAWPTSAAADCAAWLRELLR